jgi:hypothetical protein
MSPWLLILSHLLIVKRSAAIQEVLLVIYHNISSITKNMTNWAVSSWRYGEDQLIQGEGSKLIQIVEFTWESQPTSPI